VSIIKRLFGGGAEKDAADAQVAAQQQGIEEDRRQFDLNRQDFAPQIEAGNLGREELLNLLGLRGVAGEQDAVDRFSESPGQKFLRERGERTLLRNNAAIGGLGGGNVRRELQEQAIGFGQKFLGERKDRLAGVAGGGASAVANQAGLGTRISGRIGQRFANQGNARASGILDSAGRIRNTLGRVAGAFSVPGFG